MTDHGGAPSDNTTLAAVLDDYESAGYAGQFEITSTSGIRCVTCGEESEPAEFQMHARRRLEGASDPDDMLSVIAVSCPRCGAGGTLVLGFGPAASDTEADIGKQLRNRLSDGGVPPAAASGEQQS